MTPAIEEELAARRSELERHAVLRRLAARLEDQAGGLLGGAPFLPRHKALLSRDGGVCPRDGARLDFQPYEPDRHRCPRCGGSWEGERHHRAWITRYHLWLTERAVHLALLGGLVGRPALSARAAEILDAYAGRYRSYPNADNVLGPSRPFFSTYLEAIWLVQVSIAWLLLDASAPGALSAGVRGRVRDMVAESARLVASFDEGWSNRQGWNAAGLAAAGAALARPDLLDAGHATLRALLGAVDGDGHWHEGENYHLFALRGFLLGAEILRWEGRSLYSGTRLGAMYAAPLATLLPDLTLPARGDSPYGVSVRQPRFAELWELGRARAGDPRLDAILQRIYDDTESEGDDAGVSEVAEQEQNRAPSRVRRDRLGWKALLWMPPDPPGPGADWGASRLLAPRGAAVLRDGHRRMTLLECGTRGGGHAHPDRLHLSLFWDRPVLADFGTASYVSPSLHWYRSTLAHNAPGGVGTGQAPGAAVCDAFARDGPWQWCRVRGAGILGPDARVSRSVLLGPDLMLDVVTVEAPPDTVVDLPVHPVEGVDLPIEPAPVTPVPSDAGHETGYDRVELLGRVTGGDGSLPLTGRTVTLWLAPRPGETLLVGRAPGPPSPDFADGVPLAFVIRRAAGAGRWIQCVTPAGVPCAVREGAGGLLVELGGRAVRVSEAPESITITADDAPPMRLPARPTAAIPSPVPAPAPRPAVSIPWTVDAPSLDAWPARAVGFDLDAAHYRRSEAAYGAHGDFHARVELVASPDAVWFRFDVVKGEVTVRGATDPDPALDNEPADIHSDGVQCYVGSDRWAGYLVVPELDTGRIRARPVGGTAARPDGVSGASRRTGSGYQVLVGCATDAPLRPGARVRVTAVVNEMRPGRERRAGQLALAGPGWVYLRGDREPPQAAVEAVVS